MRGQDDDGFGVPENEDGDAEDGPLRGWVHPDDRLWLHPSERAAAAAAGHLPPVRPTATRPGMRGTWVVGGLTVCVALALVVTGMVVAAGSDSATPATTGVVFTGVPSTEVNLSHLTSTHQMMQLASSAQDSTVALVVTVDGRSHVGTGIVAEAGGIVVAMRPTVAGASQVTVVERDGTRQTALPVGADPTTGIVVFRIPDDLPAADLTTGDPATGSLAVALTESARRDGAPDAHLYAGTVLYAGLAAGGVPGSPSGFCATAIDAPLGTGDIGSPLVEPSGAVAGVLDAVTGAGGSRTAVFLPAELVRDVAAQIVAHGSVLHGVLGAAVVDPPGAAAGSADAGALVEWVTAGGSAAQAGLEPGDRIVAVDGAQVRSVAELVTRLYADPPGTELPLTVVRSGGTVDTTAVLGDR